MECGVVVFVEDSTTPSSADQEEFKPGSVEVDLDSPDEAPNEMESVGQVKSRMMRWTVMMTLMLYLQEDKMLNSKMLDSQSRYATLVVPDNHLDSGGEYSLILLLQLLCMSPRPAKRL